jgi:hypothetical protein
MGKAKEVSLDIGTGSLGRNCPSEVATPFGLVSSLTLNNSFARRKHLGVFNPQRTLSTANCSSPRCGISCRAGQNSERVL